MPSIVNIQYLVREISWAREEGTFLQLFIIVQKSVGITNTCSLPAWKTPGKVNKSLLDSIKMNVKSVAINFIAGVCKVKLDWFSKNECALKNHSFFKRQLCVYRYLMCTQLQSYYFNMYLRNNFKLNSCMFICLMFSNSTSCAHL